MSKVFELFVNSITSSVNGNHLEFPCSFALDIEAENEINEVLGEHDMDVDVFLGYYGWLLRAEGTKPWAFILFRNEYSLSGHLEQLSRECNGISGSAYSDLFFDDFEESDSDHISFVTVKTKDALERAARISPLLKSAWQLLADKDAGQNWICLSDPPETSWLVDALFDDREILLREKERQALDSRPSASDWFRLAQWTLDVFGETESEKSCSYLIRGEATCDIPRDLAAAAVSWNRMPSTGGPAHAMRLMGQAETIAKSASDWLALAGTWRELGNAFRHKEAMCIHRAETEAKTFMDFVQCAEYWIKIPGKTAMTRAYQCMLTAEENIVQSWDWAVCAQSWHNIFGAQVAEWSIRCLKKGELASETSDAQVWCAETWHGILGDDGLKDYYRCMNTAQALAVSVDDWICCAASWHDMFDCSERDTVRECILNAERSARTPDEWCSCACAWRQAFNQELSVDEERCLARAEACARTAQELIKCANSCALLRVHPLVNVPRFLKKAESMASSSSEWVMCAGAWRDLWAGMHRSEATDNARRCTEQAGRLAPEKERRTPSSARKDAF